MAAEKTFSFELGIGTFFAKVIKAGANKGKKLSWISRQPSHLSIHIQTGNHDV